MRSWKRLIAMALAGVLCAGCVMGCGSSDTAAEPAVGSASVSESGGKQPIITVITNSMGGETQHMLQAGAILQGQELGYTINILAPNDLGNTQEVVNDIAAAQTYSEAIVFMSNNNSIEPNVDYLNKLIPAISDARSAGIPIVMMYYDLNDDTLYDAFVGVNNYRMGRALGDYIAQNQPNAVVGLLQLDTVSKTYKIREQGIIESLQEHGCTLLEDEAITNWRSDTTKSLTASLLENHPEMTTIVCTADWLAQTAAKVVETAARAEVTAEDGEEIEEELDTLEDGTVIPESVQVYAIGPTVNSLSAIVSGSIKAEIAQQPIQIGRDSVTVADQILKGQSVKAINRTPYVLVTQDNAQAILDQINADLLAAGIGAEEE